MCSDSTGRSAGATRELARETWSEYFDALSKELLYAPVSVKITMPPGPPVVQAKHLPLLALAYDRRDDVFEVSVARGGPGLPSVLRHLVDHPERVVIDSQTMLAPITIWVEGRDQARTVITIERDAQITG